MNRCKASQNRLRDEVNVRRLIHRRKPIQHGPYACEMMLVLPQSSSML